MTLYTESAANQTDHYANASVTKRLSTVMPLWQRIDIQKFTDDAILFREIQCKKM